MDLKQYIPAEAKKYICEKPDIPSLAKDSKAIVAIDEALSRIPTRHAIYRADSRYFDGLEDDSVDLVLCSPPYWTLKEYNVYEGQLGYIQDYEDFLKELDVIWEKCFRALKKGGRLICVVGDVCLSRRKNNGVHTVVPLHASIQTHCMNLGYVNLAPIIWYKIANAKYEAEGNGAGFLGKPYEPNGVVKNDIEFILMERKPGGYRKPSIEARILSVLSQDRQREYFQQIFNGITGASTRNHPAPYPEKLAERLIRMFSFVGDTVFDPFLGTGTTCIAAAKLGRNSIGVELDPQYFEYSKKRLLDSQNLLSNSHFEFHP